jgi:hypothetical protein
MLLKNKMESWRPLLFSCLKGESKRVKDRQSNGQQKKGWKNKQRSTKQYTEIEQHEPHLKPGVFKSSGRVGSSCSTSDIRSFSNPVTSHEWGNDRIVITTNVTYQLSDWWIPIRWGSSKYIQARWYWGREISQFQ